MADRYGSDRDRYFCIPRYVDIDADSLAYELAKHMQKERIYGAKAAMWRKLAIDRGERDDHQLRYVPLSDAYALKFANETLERCGITRESRANTSEMSAATSSPLEERMLRLERRVAELEAEARKMTGDGR